MKGINRMAKMIGLKGVKSLEERAQLIHAAGLAAQQTANERQVPQWLIKRNGSLTHVEQGFLLATDKILCRVPPHKVPESLKQESVS